MQPANVSQSSSKENLESNFDNTKEEKSRSLLKVLLFLKDAKSSILTSQVSSIPKEDCFSSQINRQGNNRRGSSYLQ